MSMTALKIIYSAIIICFLGTSFIFLSALISRVKFSAYVKRKNINIWESAAKKIQWVGIPLPKFLWFVDASQLTVDQDQELSKEPEYTQFKNAVIKHQRTFLISFIICFVALVLVMFSLIITN